MYCEIVYVSVCCVFVYTFVPSRTGCIQAHCIYIYIFFFFLFTHASFTLFSLFLFLSFFFLFFFFLLLSIKRIASFLAPLSINERTIFFFFFFFDQRSILSIVSVINASRDFSSPFFPLFLTLSSQRNSFSLFHSHGILPSFQNFYPLPSSLSLSLSLFPTFFLSLVLSIFLFFFSYAQTLFRFLSRMLWYLYICIYIYKNTKNNLQNDIISIFYTRVSFLSHTLTVFWFFSLSLSSTLPRFSRCVTCRIVRVCVSACVICVHACYVCVYVCVYVYIYICFAPFFSFRPLSFHNLLISFFFFFFFFSLFWVERMTRIFEKFQEILSLFLTHTLILLSVLTLYSPWCLIQNKQHAEKLWLFTSPIVFFLDIFRFFFFFFLLFWFVSSLNKI